MASIGNDPNGCRRILFVAGDGRRRTIRLGKVTSKLAEKVKCRVELLNAAAISGEPIDDETARWLKRCSQELLDKLAAVGLIQTTRQYRLGEFLDGYHTQRSDVKPATRLFYGHTKRNLKTYFGPERPLRSITAGDAEDFRRWLTQPQEGKPQSPGLADNTVRRRCALTRQFFGYAVRKGYIDHNPFDAVGPVTVGGNADRQYFVTRAEAQAVLDACPDAQWRLLFALSRYGGLRCPSEHLGLRWSDVNWELGRITIHSPKTEHHEGGATRVIPIFPELKPYLDAAWDEAPEPADYVITRYRDPGVNLRSQLLKIIKRAGLTPWPKLWQNLRSSRQTELEDTFPGHVVCKWIGNSRRVAAEHYLQITEEHYQRGCDEATGKAARNPAQQPAATTGNPQQGEEAPKSQPVDITASCGNLPETAGGCYPPEWAVLDSNQ